MRPWVSVANTRGSTALNFADLGVTPESIAGNSNICQGNGPIAGPQTHDAPNDCLIVADFDVVGRLGGIRTSGKSNVNQSHRLTMAPQAEDL